MQVAVCWLQLLWRQLIGIFYFLEIISLEIKNFETNKPEVDFQRPVIIFCLSTSTHCSACFKYEEGKLKVTCLLVTSLEILVANTHF